MFSHFHRKTSNSRAFKGRALTSQHRNIHSLNVQPDKHVHVPDLLNCCSTKHPATLIIWGLVSYQPRYITMMDESSILSVMGRVLKDLACRPPHSLLSYCKVDLQRHLSNMIHVTTTFCLNFLYAALCNINSAPIVLQQIWPFFFLLPLDIWAPRAGQPWRPLHQPLPLPPEHHQDHLGTGNDKFNHQQEIRTTRKCRDFSVAPVDMKRWRFSSWQLHLVRKCWHDKFLTKWSCQEETLHCFKWLKPNHSTLPSAITKFHIFHYFDLAVTCNPACGMYMIT